MRAAAGARVVAAVLVVAAVVATWAGVAGPAPSPWDFFGYFTIQSNLIGAAVALIGAVRLLRRTAPTTGWTVVRWSAATYLVVVGVVYWALLAPLGAAGGVTVPWANLVLHALLPVAAAADWVLVRDRVPVAAGRVAAVLAYPALWTAVVLVRGATDGWVPYPFLNPAQGPVALTAWVALVAGAFVGAALLLRALARRRPASRG